MQLQPKGKRRNKFLYLAIIILVVLSIAQPLFEFKGKVVIEIGSRYVNGSVRPLIEKFCKPKEYIGVDISPGKFVDKIVPAEKLVKVFGKNRFGVVISTEMLEHVSDWKKVINNMKEILKPGGYIYQLDLKGLDVTLTHTIFGDMK